MQQTFEHTPSIPMPAQPHRTETGLTRWVTILLLAAAVLLGHAWCLRDGTVLDDWQHQKHLRESGWSLDELQRSLTIQPADWVHHWWQTREMRWEYARPLFILTMKTIYHALGGDDPFWLHAYSLLLHFLCVLMTWRLAFRLMADRFWSAVAGLSMAVYPHAVMTVQWSSSQNCVQQTVLTLAALLCYIRASQISIAPSASLQSNLASPQIRRGWFALTAAFWLLGLLTKENALLLPPIAIAFDLAFGGWRRVRARFVPYVSFAVLGIAFLAWRAKVITLGMPDVYIRRPDGDWGAYLGFCAAKLLHYLTTAIWPAPMMIGPTGRYDPWSETPGTCFAMLAIVSVLGLGYFIAARRMRGWWIWPLWILLAVLPVTPVIATAHSGYLAGVGFTIALVLGPAARRNTNSETRASVRARWALSPAIAIGSLLATMGLTALNRWQWSGMIAAERLLPAWVAADPPATAVKDVYLINAPFVNIYAKPQLDRLLGKSFESSRLHVLAYAPQPVLIEQRVTVEQLSPNSFAVSIEGQPWFSRLLGRFLLEAFRGPGPLPRGLHVETGAFEVDVAEADDAGVRRLVFSFPALLDDPRYCFYLTTADCGAAKIRFHGGEPTSRPLRTLPPELLPTRPDAAAALRIRVDGGDASAMDALLEGRRTGVPEVAAACESASREVLATVARSLGSRVQPLLLGPHVEPDPLAPPPRIAGPPAAVLPPTIDEAGWEQIENWWRSEVTAEQLKMVWTRRGEFEYLVKDREEVPHARQWAALAIRSDLYLTGRPFPGPRRE
ncbi:MAG: hypothetical protein HZB38_09685 [Planctomycetes bacterium]|nr:hypothetical protein [Planctomycetota bacterium]